MTARNGRAICSTTRGRVCSSRQGIWRTLDDFSTGAVCLCLASELYEPEDYIYDYEEFLKYKGCSR